MMALLNLFGILAIGLGLYLCLREDIIELMAMAVIIFTLELYLLAFIGGLGISGPITLLLGGLLLYAGSRKGRGLGESLKQLIKNDWYALAIVTALLVFTFIMTGDHIAVWWDDINYWAVDTKALYFLGGFPGKYGNVAPEFGDYPPGIQLFKYFILSFGADFDEGLGFAGYYLLNVLLLLPLWKRQYIKNRFLQLPWLILIMLIPGVVSSVWDVGTCSDLTMGILYGLVLISVIDYREKTSLFYYLRISLYMALMLLCKSTGFMWAGFALLFILLERKEYVKPAGESRYRTALRLMPVVVSALTQGSWWLFCLVNRRVAKLTAANLSGGMGFLDDREFVLHKLDLFLRGLAGYPLNTNNGSIIGLCLLAAVLICAGLLLIFAGLKQPVEYKSLKRAGIFSLCVAFAEEVFILYEHLTVFAGETQYETAQVMAISISRYSLPLTISLVMLVIYALMRIEHTWAAAAAFALVLLTTDYQAYARCLWGYRATLEEDADARANMLRDSAVEYARTIAGNRQLWGKRVLYLREREDNRWVENTYLNYETAPVANVYGVYWEDEPVGAEENRDYAREAALRIIEEAEKNHTDMIYIDGELSEELRALGFKERKLLNITELGGS